MKSVKFILRRKRAEWRNIQSRMRSVRQSEPVWAGLMSWTSFCNTTVLSGRFSAINMYSYWFGTHFHIFLSAYTVFMPQIDRIFHNFCILLCSVDLSRWDVRVMITYVMFAALMLHFWESQKTAAKASSTRSHLLLFISSHAFPSFLVFCVCTQQVRLCHFSAQLSGHVGKLFELFEVSNSSRIRPVQILWSSVLCCWWCVCAVMRVRAGKQTQVRSRDESRSALDLQR